MASSSGVICSEFSHQATIQQDVQTKVELCDKATVKFSKNSAMEATSISLSLYPNPSKVLEKYLYASFTLDCSPSYESRDSVKIRLPTFCVPLDGKQVDVVLCTKTGDQWNEVDSHCLTPDGFLTLYRKKLDNITALLPVESIMDVKFHIRCLLFRGKNGDCAFGFCIFQKSAVKDLQERLSKKKYDCVFTKIDILTVKMNEVIDFGFTKRKRFQVLAEDVFSPEGHVSYDDVGCSQKHLEFTITQRTKDAENSATPVFEKSYDITPDSDAEQGQRSSSESCCDITVGGNAKVENFIKNADKVNICDTGHNRDFWKEPFKREPQKASTSTSDLCGKTGQQQTTSSVNVKGNFQARNMVIDSKEVNINSKPGKEREHLDYRNEEEELPSGNVQEPVQPEDMAKPTWNDCETEDGKRRYLRRRPGHSGDQQGSGGNAGQAVISDGEDGRARSSYLGALENLNFDRLHLFLFCVTFLLLMIIFKYCF